MTEVPQERCADTCRVSGWFFRWFLCSAFLVCAAVAPATAQNSDNLPNANPSLAATPDAGPAVWFADRHRAYRVPVTTHQVDHVIPFAHEITALAVDPRDRGLWALSHKHLLKFDAHTSLVRDVDLDHLVPNPHRHKDGKRHERKVPGFEKIEDPTALVLNPYDGTLWVHAEKTLLHVDETGHGLAVWKSRQKIEALSLSLDASIWVLTEEHLIRLSSDARELASYRIASRGHHGYRHVVVDALGGVVWLADKRSLHQLPLADLSTRVAIEVYGGASRDDKGTHRHDDDDNKGDENDKHSIEGLALDPLTGTVWLAHKHSLRVFGRDGSLLGTVDFAGQRVHRIDTLAFDAASRSVWVGGKRTLARIGTDAVVVAKIGLDHELKALGVSPLALVPRLNLLQPGPDLVTNNAKLPLRLGWGALCNGVPCDAGQGYIDTLSLDVLLNDQAIGSDFIRSLDETVYVPTGRYPEGPNTFTAQVRDGFGHLSVPVSGRFTVDTAPPALLNISPADGSNVTTSDVILEGRLDDATAVIALENLTGVSGIVIRDDPLDFAFKVPLKPGPNAFTLIATDAAGNETRETLNVTRTAGVSVRVDNVTDGTTVTTDRILIMGTFDGPLNTGITVNGQIAQTYGQRFFANNVGLNPGANTITIIATTLDGAKREQTLTITSTAAAAFTVERAAPAAVNVRTIAGTGIDGFTGEGGPAKEAALSWPYGVAVGPDGSVYIADSGNHRVRRVLADGSIVTVAGTGQPGFSGEGGPATEARLNNPNTIALGADGSLYIADSNNNRVRKIGLDGRISTIAGGEYPDAVDPGDGGPATQAWLDGPTGVAVGPEGSVYIADIAAQRVRKVAPDGTITTVAGTGKYGYAGDGGPADQALLASPYTVTAGADGSLYIADTGNNRIRRVAPDGTISTAAGSGEYGNDGDGGPAGQAQLAWPASVALAPDGSFYIVDNENNRIRRVDAEGTISAVAGTGAYGYAGDGGNPLAADFAWPYDAAMGPDGTLYVADSENQRIRAFTTLNTSGASAPLLVGFRLDNHTTGAIQRVEADYNGDGTVDFSTTDGAAPLQHYYAQSGAYVVRFTVTDTGGLKHVFDYAVVLPDVANTDSMLRAVYADMLSALKAQDTDTALKAVTGGAYEKYKSVFTVLHADLPQVVDQLGELQGGVIGEEMAEYVLVRGVKGKKITFLLYFLKSEDGVWRIDGM